MEMTNHKSNDSYDYYDDYENFTIPSRDFCPARIGQISVTDWVAMFQYSLVFVFGVPGNGLVLWITTFQMKRSVNTIWFQNLAVADLLCCLSMPFNIMGIILEYWPLGLFACKFIPVILFINMYTSVFLLTMISIDRCALVIKPVWCQNNRTLRKAYMTCTVIWILAAILSSLSSIFRTTIKCDEIVTCIHDTALLGHYRKRVENLITFSHFLIGFVVPCLVIIVCYALLIHRVKLRFAHNTKTMKLAITVIIGFFVCWFPYNVVRAILLMNVNSSPLYESASKLQDIVISLAFMNSCINPIIYVLMGKNFKSKIKRSFKVIIKNVLEEETPNSESNKISLTSQTKDTEASL